MTAELRALLADHDGVITRAQATRLGMSSSAIGRRTDSGAWTSVARGVYFVADREMTGRARVRIASATVGPAAVVSGPAAAWWHDLVDRPPRMVTVTVPRGRHPAVPSGVDVVHRDLHPVDVIERAHLAVTGIPFTVLETAAAHGVAILDSSLLRGRVSLRQLVAAHARYPGRRGAGVSARMLTGAANGARSEAERTLLRLLRAARIGGWVAGHPSCGYVVDVAFCDQMLAVEIDGFAFHSDARAFQDDRTRQNVLVTAGWTILRFTWQDLTERPQLVIAQIQAALADHR